ncbi:MAG: hypothetical protein RLZZ297_2032 [Chloroflexota bacterium]|jgi:cytoskeletal protein RodZ
MQLIRLLIVLIVLILGYFWYTGQFGEPVADTTTPTMEVAPTATYDEATTEPAAATAEPTVAAPTAEPVAPTAEPVATATSVAASATPAPTAPTQTVVTFSEADINAKLESMNTDMVTVNGIVFKKDDVAVTLTVSGIKGVLHANLVAEGGKIVIKDPYLEGRLRMIPVGMVVTPMQEAINTQLAGKTPIEQVRVLDGSLEITFAAE